MRHVSSLLIWCAAAAGCTDFESRTQAPEESSLDVAELARTRTGGGISVADPADLPTIHGTGTSPSLALSIPWCSLTCTAVTSGAAAGCGAFTFTGVLAGSACGLATSGLCIAVCSSVGPTSHCDEIPGGKACMNRERFWWCDTKVDGRKARARYELEDLSQPGVVHTSWAPSLGCTAVRWPTAGLVKRWQICVEEEGCSDWFYPNHHDATASSYIPSGTPPSTEPPETPDVTPPSISVGGTDPSSWYAGVVPIVANATDDESGVASMTIYINDEPIYYTPGGSIDMSWDSSGYNGSMALKVAATDGVGNTSFTWLTINVSNRPPTVDLHVPWTISSQAFFYCSVSGVGPTSKAVLVDGSPIDNDHGWDSYSVPDGYHTLGCRAVDVMGRVADSSGQFYVYNHPSGLRWIYPVYGTYTATAAEPILELEASADETDMDMAEIYDDSGVPPDSFMWSSNPLCRRSHNPNDHTAMDLHCDGDHGAGNRGLNIAGRAEGPLMLWLHVTAHNDYQMTAGAWSYGHSIYIDNTPPVVTLDATQTQFVEVDGIKYVQLVAVTPTPETYYSEHRDSIERVEFFVLMPDGSSASLGSVNSDAYPWTLTERVPDNAFIDGQVTLYAVATDTVYSHQSTPVHRTGTSAQLQLTVDQQSDVAH